MRKFNLFNFLEKKMTQAEMSAVIAEELEKASFKELALHIAISYIANSLSKCEIKTFENGKEVKGDLYYALNFSPNPNQSASEFVNQIIENYFYNGEALVTMENDKFYCADEFDLVDDNPLKEYVYHNVTFNGHQVRKRYKGNDVFHFKLDNKDVKKIIELLYAQYGEIMELALQTFKRTNGKKYKLILDEYRAGDKKFNDLYETVLKQQLKTFVENDNSVYPKFKGMDLEEFSSATAGNTNDVIALRKEIFDVVAQAFKIPLSMMYGNITNINDVVKVYLSFCIDPIADMLSEEMTRKWYTVDEWKRGCYIEVDTTCINYVDILEVADKADKAISCGLASIDEVRQRVRLKKLDTEFSTSHFMTKNYELAENILKNVETEGG